MSLDVSRADVDAAGEADAGAARGLKSAARHLKVVANACIARGASAFSVSGYSTKVGRWGALDTSWRAELAVRRAKVAEAVMLEESRPDLEAVSVSTDRQYVYYRGRQLSIENCSDSEEPGFHPHGSADRAFAEKIRESIDGASQEGGK